ncbi:TetR/AcrR family transcriptional regulator [Bradyrhizobium sp. STM 3562]|uniref:TetR/AcrR family transcriptional regulator n=1 Tax=Bradyrhizobium sp. STM 3562 TaxID=578924 RepID=UPI00388D714B
MATQSERRQATQAAILKAAKRLFGERGFAATTIDEVAASAHVAKGAVYHHFETKEALFEAVFDLASQDLLAEVDRAAASEEDALSAMAKGTQAYFTACAKGATGQIVLHDGPAVLGWERWREIDNRHFGGRFATALKRAMDDGLIAPQPIEPLSRLLLGAVTEAAVACSGRDLRRAGSDYARAFHALLDALRVK